ncbi:MAG: hypothetical protein AAGC77_11880 [Pseudomonadota bacterium]
MKIWAILAAGAMLVASCSTLSPRAQVEGRFVGLGLSLSRAACLAEELDGKLSRDDLLDVADYVSGLNRASSAGEALDALLRIDNPRAALAIGQAGLICALRG